MGGLLPQLVMRAGMPSSSAQNHGSRGQSAVGSAVLHREIRIGIIALGTPDRSGIVRERGATTRGDGDRWRPLVHFPSPGGIMSTAAPNGRAPLSVLGGVPFGAPHHGQIVA